jgi:hypothetical protein
MCHNVIDDAMIEGEGIAVMTGGMLQAPAAGARTRNQTMPEYRLVKLR